MAECKWPAGTCACLMAEHERPDTLGRVWMHCEEGLNLSKASMSRFIMFCLENCVEIGDIYPFSPEYPRSQVVASVRINPDMIPEFEEKTGGKLRKPPKLSLN